MNHTTRRGRFAPTPSGLLHLGNAFTALAAWLQIRQAGGEFALRVEDIDKPRSRQEWVSLQLQDLKWLGIDWDEGPDLGGAYAPYTQSERENLYEEALARLISSGMLYPCYCSRKDLAQLASAPHGLSSEGPAYPGFCRHLTEAEQAAKAADKSPSLRFFMPASSPACQFRDSLSGENLRFDCESLGDFVVRRADGIFSYQLAVTVDDAAMAITDVLRGADLLDSTPRQLALYEALGLHAPAFAHVPLIADASGERLSKRDKSLTLASLRERGVRPERLVGALASLAGWIDQPRELHASELISLFGPIKTKINSPLIFDRELEAWLFGG
ncbi:tRNA glutamyl-Q(34) synthetase GluQRS [Paenibacillus sp. HB172176]|uniref:tRNA glutamyl-Q(34) synthetase GluQRS n=1 Tax=Paenibacillus sp. HB172176 TaxID=2493690 RepID=UPI00143B1168|nr:tRNA glutamyl-Q(34) synthetase GluQRS [Paenibacillus sp. HB172176]